MEKMPANLQRVGIPSRPEIPWKKPQISDDFGQELSKMDPECSFSSSKCDILCIGPEELGNRSFYTLDDEDESLISCLNNVKKYKVTSFHPRMAQEASKGPTFGFIHEAATPRSPIQRFSSPESPKKTSKMSKELTPNKFTIPEENPSQTMETLKIESNSNSPPNAAGVTETVIVKNQSAFTSLIAKREEELAKPIYFNVIVAGESGAGKSTFIDAFFKKSFQRIEVIRSPTTQIVEHVAERRAGKLTLIMKLIDTPGYSSGSEDLVSACKIVKDYIRIKLDEYSEEDFTFSRRQRDFQRPTRFSSSSKQQPKDNRVHACLYFLTGPRVNQNDLFFMKKLSKYVSIIPVLAKGDAYTIEEIKEIKKNWIVAAKEQKIEWFDCSLGLNNREAPNTIPGHPSKFEPTPPFVIVSSSDMIELPANKVVYGRKYSWGMVNVDDPDHSEFTLLYKLLIGSFSLQCIKLTDYYWEANNARKLRKKNRPKKSINGEKLKSYAFGTALFVGLISTTALYIKSKLGKS